MTVPRRLALMIVIIILSSAAASAKAGEYAVYSCHPAAGNVNRSWVGQANHGGMLAYANCVTSDTRSWNVGLVTRPTTVPGNPGATVPTGAFAGLTFTAPPGARLARMSYTQEWCGNGAFRSGVVNAAGTWLRWGTIGFCHVVDQPSYTLNLGGTTAARIQTFCHVGPCLVGGSQLRAWATTRSVIMVVSDSTRPAARLTGGTALRKGWLRGVIGVTVAASDNVGISGVTVRLGEAVLAAPVNRCDFTARVPCPSDSRLIPLNTRAASDGTRLLTYTARDAAGNTATAARTLHVDNTPPPAPIGLATSSTNQWRASNDFAATWRNPNETTRAPIAGAVVAICPASLPSDAWTGCVYRTTRGSNLAALSGIKVPRAGRWNARIWLVDAAGNSDRRTAQSVPLLLDDAPPTVVFGPLDPQDPGRIDVRATDATSAINRSEIEFRRRGTRTWTSLPVTRVSGGFSARLDDEHLANGIYELRARAVDSAGNEQSTRGVAVRRVPIRIDTRLTVGELQTRKVRRARGRKPLVRRVIVVRPNVRYGRTVPVVGRLTTPGGNPVSNASIEVWQRISRPTATWRRIALVGTNGSGRFKFKALRGPSRLLRFRYAGTNLVRARTSEVDIAVQAGATIRASRTRVVNGGDVRFTGRVLGRHLPATGKLVKLQAFSRGAWRTFATPRAHPRTGRWSYDYRFTATRGTVRYRFRAEVPRESGFPYSRGVSRAIPVVVRGL